MSYCVGCASCAIMSSCSRAERAALVSRSTQQWIGYAGTLLFMLGALAISTSPTWSLHPAPFAAFLVGHIVWGGLAYFINERPLLVMNGFYLIFDIWALAIRW